MAIDPQVKDLIRVGEVSAINNSAGTCDVVFDDDNGFVATGLQVIQKNTQDTMDYWMPDVGEDVLCLFLPGGEGEGFVLGSFYADEITPPTGANSGTKRITEFQDGTRIEYDWDAHKLKATIGDTTIEATEDEIKVNAVTDFKVTAPTITFDGDLNVTGNISSEGEVTAKSKTAPVALSTHVHPSAMGATSAPTPSPSV